MRKFALSLALVGLLAFGGAAFAEIGTIDDVPAATLLLPYFEVDLTNTDGVNTTFSINNASAQAAVAHVTLWTDWSIPTFDFDVYLTGYDVQVINLRNLFTFGDGIGVPRTAELSLDGTDTISPHGDPSWDDNFPGDTGPCASPYSAGDNVPASIVDNLRKAHTGVSATIGLTANKCFGFGHGDNIARGYITIDNVTECNLDFPADAGYASILSNRNQLWGDYFYINGAQNFAQGETLVHIEACELTNPPTGDTDSLDGLIVGYGFPYCTGGTGFTFNDYTFYARYVVGPPAAGQDQRESLATTFATRYLQGGGFTGGTDLIVWRDAKVGGTNNPPVTCGNEPFWFPLNQEDVVGFDEAEQPEDLCVVGDIFSPPSGGEQTCFPLEAGRYPIEGGNPAAVAIAPSANFGWLYLNLNHELSASDDDWANGIAQAWVTTVMDANGRFSVGFDAIKLDSALDPDNIELLD